MDPRIVVVLGAKKDTITHLKDAETTIGRDTASVLCLSEESVSRKHCAIQTDGDTYRVIDFDSSNGTFVNGQRVKMVMLKPGDSVGIGKHTIVVTDSVEVRAHSLDNVAVKPAVPIAIACARVSPVGSLTSQSPFTRARSA